MKPHAVAVRASLGAETCILHAISTSYHCHIALVITVCQRAKQRGKRRFVVGHICTPPLSGTSQHPLKRQPFTEVVASHSTALKCTDGDTALIPGLPVPSFVIQIQERLRLSATRPGGCDAAIRVITALGRHRRRHRTASDESAALAIAEGKLLQSPPSVLVGLHSPSRSGKHHSPQSTCTRSSCVRRNTRIADGSFSDTSR
eukprot:CAMPEP_0181240456 /NCGR_PEP_ID=MMETSP1096-20121128/40542_1 /TAXON_ID=156174 ORGANISM="Chrysochromulina ericina, Strain CCMP281" /NCGR_SAMPLE_ID=MMETSP1096 /ASSEMBLY_ACC=CAM_ASM_000453 /LENGTH=201 /DNA_ID=CAMNT_0023336351 /DNA_START=90 /DNA_END=692 /DNA_ORIENTATION=+